MKAIRLLMLVLVLFCGRRAAFAQELSQTFTSSEGFSIKLPADWKRIDKQTIAESVKTLAQEFPNARLGNAVDAFGLEIVQQGIGFPRIIVIHNRVGKPTEQDLKQLAASMQEMRQKIQKDANSAFGKNVLSASPGVDDVSFNEQGRFIRVVSTILVPDFGVMRGINVIFPTEFGLLTFQFSSTEKEYGQYANLFSEITKSIEITKSARSPMVKLQAGSTEDKSPDHYRYEPYIENGIKFGIPIFLIFAYNFYKHLKKSRAPVEPSLLPQPSVPQPALPTMSVIGSPEAAQPSLAHESKSATTHAPLRTTQQTLPATSLYVTLNEEAKGPFTIDQLQALLAVNAITDQTLCCHEGADEWLTVAAYLGKASEIK